MKDFPSRRLPNIFARIQLPFQKRFVFTGLMTFNQNGYLIIRTTFAPKDFDANVQMSVKKLFFATSTVLPA